MKTFLIEQFKHFEIMDVLPGKQIKEAIVVFLAWAVPAFLFVLWASVFYPEVKFYKDAITEGIGPNLWNAIGSFGFFSVGVAIIFSKYFYPSVIAERILSNTYAIGSLSFGLLLGQWSFLLTHNDLIWWKVGFFGITSGLLLVVVFFFNLFIWYLSYLIKPSNSGESDFLFKLGQMHILWRVIIGLIFCAITLVLFLSEK